MHTNYRTELKKEMKNKTGSGAGEVYRSTKWYYIPLSFLRDHELQELSTSNFSENPGSPLNTEQERQEVITTFNK